MSGDVIPGRRKRVRAPQTSYLRNEIDHCKKNLSQLLHAFEILGQINTVLRLRLDSCRKSISKAEQTLQQQAASRHSLSRPAQRLMYNERRYQTSVCSLPPPEQWDDKLELLLGSLTRDEVRCMVLNGYRDAFAMLQSASQNPGILPQIRLAVRKGSAFVKLQSSHNSNVWSCIRGSNLETGDHDVPKDWYVHVALCVPSSLLPPWFREQLRMALSTYSDKVKSLLHQRSSLKRRLSKVVPLTTNAQHPSSCKLACLPPTNESEDVFAQTDDILLQLEQTFTHELQAASQLTEHVLSTMPVELSVFMIGTSAPYHLNLFEAVTALCARVGPNMGMATQSQQQLLSLASDRTSC